MPVIHIYSGSPDANGDYPFELIGSFSVFTPALQFGINLAAGDINGNGGNEIVVAADAGYLPAVEVYTVAHTTTSVTATLESTFQAYSSAYRGGVRVAVGDLNNDGFGELVTAPGDGHLPTVNVYSFDSASSDFSLVKTFDAFPTTFQRGVDVAVGDYNGDGIRDIIVGAGAGWTPTVSVYSGTNVFNDSSLDLINSFLAYDSGYRGGVKVAAKTIAGDNPDFPEQVDVEASFDWQAGQWFFAFSTGGRYLRLEQSYEATLFNPGGATQQQHLRAVNEFNGGGPTVAGEARWDLGESRLSLFGLVRGSLLVGEVDNEIAFTSVSPGVFANSSRESSSLTHILPVTELELGLEFGSQWRGANYFLRTAMVNQVYFDAGNTSSQDGNLSLFGVQFSLGVDF